MENQRYEKYDRDPAVRRRYGRAWKRIRDSYASAQPLCEQCLAKGKYVKTEEIHHKQPLSKGETHDRNNLMLFAKSVMQESMRKVETDGIKIKKPRIIRDIYFRRVSHSKKRGIVSNFISTSTTNDVTVAISATIGNTSFRNSGNCPMCCHYPSTGFFACQDSPLGHKKYNTECVWSQW